MVSFILPLKRAEDTFKNLANETITMIFELLNQSRKILGSSLMTGITQCTHFCRLLITLHDNTIHLCCLLITLHDNTIHLCRLLITLHDNTIHLCCLLIRLQKEESKRQRRNK